MSERGLLHLRYRPSADVATAHVDLPDIPVLSTRRTTDDVDVVLDWTSTPEGELLTGFSLLHCNSRLDSLTGPAGPLPPGIARIVRDLVRSSPTTDTGDRRAAFSQRFDRTVELPLHDLLGPGPDQRPGGSHAAARELARAVQRFARALDAADPDRSDRSAALLRALQELGAAIAAGGGSRASGALHEAQRAVRGGLPLTDHERRQLLALLQRAENPAEWSGVAAGLSDLAQSVAP